MTRSGFIVANLLRRKARTALTLLSLVCAFLLFGLLQAVDVLFEADVSFVGATRLVTQARVSFTQPLPIRMLPLLEAVPGVQAVAQVLWFGAVAPDNTTIVALAVDPARIRSVSPQWVMPDAQWQAFANDRSGMIAGRLMAEKYGWTVGSRIPLRSNVIAQRDGSMNWAFDLVGIFDGSDEVAQKQTSRVYVNYAHVDEAAIGGSGNAGFFVLRLADPQQAAAVAHTIDAMFENSADETKTEVEQQWVLGFAKQIGDVRMIVRWILLAVFATLLLVVGNTMAQAVRERIPELAVLKVLGYSDATIFAFVLSEALILCASGGLVGLSAATLAGYAVAQGAGFPFIVGTRVWIAGVIAIVALSLAVGLIPALRARRLKIVDALAMR